MANEGHKKTGDEVKEEEEVIQTQGHRRILNAENITEAKQLLLIHQVGTVEFIFVDTYNAIDVMNRVDFIC